MTVSTRSMNTRVTRSGSRSSTTNLLSSVPSASSSRARRSSTGNIAQRSIASSAKDRDDHIKQNDEVSSKTPGPKLDYSGKNTSKAPSKRRKSAPQSGSRPRSRKSGLSLRPILPPPLNLGVHVIDMIFEFLCAPEEDEEYVGAYRLKHPASMEEEELEYSTTADSLITGPFFPQPSMCPSGWKEMCTASLVAKSWRDVAQTRLFRDAHVVNVPMLDKLVKATKEPRIGELVRTITLADANFPMVTSEIPPIAIPCDTPKSSLSSLIRNCPNLQKIYLDFPISSCILEGTSFPSITTLRLSNSYGQSTQDIIYLLSRLPSLETLVLPPDNDCESIQNVDLPEQLCMAPLKSLALTLATQPRLLLFLTPATRNLERLVLVPGPTPAGLFHSFVEEFMNNVIEHKPPLYFVSIIGHSPSTLHAILRSCSTIQEIRVTLDVFDDEQNTFPKIFRSSRSMPLRITFVCVRTTHTRNRRYLDAFPDAEELRSLSEGVRLLISMQRLEYIGFALSGNNHDFDVPESAYDDLKDVCYNTPRRKRIEVDAPNEYYMSNGLYSTAYVPMKDNWLSTTSAPAFPLSSWASSQL
ncbi:hypothetical protein SCHPADRAFT_887148 [Schizopora paradoxa]|uniref:F-box domain-containing protein n=1 Tax=Schizopora paradoxa TaxID=27342 RepID=A0A0H2RZY3_9AGAM|nr:hypothetical protein SCHPADRAFT_887148 [Schizopora paradoxa]